MPWIDNFINLSIKLKNQCDDPREKAYHCLMKEVFNAKVFHEASIQAGHIFKAEYLRNKIDDHIVDFIIQIGEGKKGWLSRSSRINNHFLKIQISYFCNNGRSTECYFCNNEARPRCRQIFCKSLGSDRGSDRGSDHGVRSIINPFKMTENLSSGGSSQTTSTVRSHFTLVEESTKAQSLSISELAETQQIFTNTYKGNIPVKLNMKQKALVKWISLLRKKYLEVAFAVMEEERNRQGLSNFVL
ncbi:hypothetical protein GLOIN_2v1736298 [Rhizophagus irregularis DAOM 181602=DAOM 197198]|nr:hypothetical protein GLOIN_2v1736298 [Rhizophagus irregularis DAOM 181602=DAOM 197198]